MARSSHRSGAAGAILCLFLAVVLCTAGCSDLLHDRTSSLRQGTTGDLQAYFLDVGQGDSSVILFRDKVILIDAGETDEGGTVVRDLQRLGVTRIDLLVATHPHSDHIGGMQDVLENFEVAKVLDSGQPSTSAIYERFLESVEQEGIPYIVAEQGQTIAIDPFLRILVLSPPEDRIGDDLNANSIVLRISYGTVDLLYTGDATAAAEDETGSTGYPLDAEVLKTGHHGSSGSSSAAFLSRVSPEIAVISAGSGNPYGHPHEVTLGRLESAGAAIYRTDLDGTILVQSNGDTYSVMTEAGGDNIWQAAFVSPEPSATATPQVTAPAYVTAVTVTMPQILVGNASTVYIDAVQFDAPGDDRLNLNGEWVRVANGGDTTVLLAGWTLSDKDTRDLYTFPATILLPEESVTVYTGSGMMNDSSLFMGMADPVFANSGDIAVLRDGSGTIIDQMEV